MDANENIDNENENNKSILDLTNSKLDYHRSLRQSLESERHRMKQFQSLNDTRKSTIDSPSRSSIIGRRKFDESFILDEENGGNNNNSNSHHNRHSINYRTLSTGDHSGVVSLLTATTSSHHSLNNSNSSGIDDDAREQRVSSTAARMTSRLLESVSTGHSETGASPSTATDSSTRYLGARRRFRTVVKADRYSRSSYLSRVAVNDDLSGNLPSNNRPIVTDLPSMPLSTQSQRIDFSMIRSRNVPQPSLDRSTWICARCGVTDLDRAFNFCPGCAAPRDSPVKTGAVAAAVATRAGADGGWRCARCTTANDRDRSVCVFCFAAKTANESTKKRRLSIDEDDRDREPKSMKIDSKTNWNCPDCFVENRANSARCVCCTAANPNEKPINEDDRLKPRTAANPGFVFGCPPTSAETASIIKFGCPPTSFQTQQAFKFGTSGINNDNLEPMKPVFSFGTPRHNSNDRRIATESIKNNRSEEPKSMKIVDSKPGWNCPDCWAENRADSARCVCCTAANPNGVAIDQVANGCPPTAIKFGTSGTKNDNQEPMKPVFSFGTPSHNSNDRRIATESIKTQKRSFSIDEDDRAEEPKSMKIIDSKPNWNCQDCWADNSADSARCVCCMAANPNEKPINEDDRLKSRTAVNPGFVFGCPPISTGTAPAASNIKFGTSGTNNEHQEPMKPVFSFGTPRHNSNDKKIATESIKNNRSEEPKSMKIVDSKPGWNCPDCWAENRADSARCVCCTAANPNGVAIDQVANGCPPTAIKFGTSDTNNDNQEPMKSVFSFGTPSHNTNNSSSDKSLPSVTKAIPTWSFLSAPVSAGWQCSCCLVDNKAEATTCVCCSTPCPKPIVNGHDSSALSFTFASPKSLGCDLSPGIDSCAVDLVFEFAEPGTMRAS